MSTAEKDLSLGQELDVLKPEIEKVLPEHVTADKFMRVVMTSIAQSPDLRQADRRTLLTACVKAATDGLVPDGREAALVIFNTKTKVNENGRTVERWVKQVQYMPMVAGILKKVRNSGELKSIASNVVYELDKFRYWIDDAGEHVMHEPNVLAKGRGDFLAVYAIAETKDGGIYIEVMSRSQVEQVRDVSKAKDSGPWKSWFDEMARKTVIRRLSKRLPMSTDLETVITRDDSMYDLNGGGRGNQIEATGGVAGAKAALGLPNLPLNSTGSDIDPSATNTDPDAGDDATPPDNVDTETGEVIPQFDQASAIKALEAKRTTKTLEEQFVAIAEDYDATGREFPFEIKAKYDELRDHLKLKEKEL